MNALRVLVVTCAHRGDDARIVQRQISAMVDAGYQVTLIAPEPLQTQVQQHVVIRRATGRRRVSSWFDVLRNVIKYRRQVDLLLVHDLELAALLSFIPGLPQRIFDVHEDLAQSVTDRSWIPAPLSLPTRKFVQLLEKIVTFRFALILAENSYQKRFPGQLVIPNSTHVPLDCPAFVAGDNRVIYIGRISAGRGWRELLRIAEQLKGRAVVHLIGEADHDIRSDVELAHQEEVLHWHGYVANPDALHWAEGSLIGLSLLDDLANYRHSMPTKIAECFARGIPVISSSLPKAKELIDQSESGWIVEPPLAESTVKIIDALLLDIGKRENLGVKAHKFALDNLDWNQDSKIFLAFLRTTAVKKSR